MGYSPGYTIPSAVQFTTEQQDIVSVGGTRGAGSIFNGIGFVGTVAAGNPGTTITNALASGILMNVAGGPLSPSYYTAATPTFTIGTSGGTATFSYTAISSGGSITGLTQITGLAGGSTIAATTEVYFQSLIIPDVIDGGSIARGDGGILGFTDWGTILNNTENNLAGLIQQGTGLVFPIYNDGIYGGLQWATSTGTGSVPSEVGSPAVVPSLGQGTVTITAVSGNGTTVTFIAANSYLPGQTVTLAALGGGFAGLNGTQTVATASGTQFTVTNATTGATTTGTSTTPLQALPSSLLVTSASTIPGDTRSFRRVMLFFQKQTNGDGITFATTGVVKSSGKIDTNGSGLAVWDSGDLGYGAAGTGFTSTWGTHATGSGGAGVVLVAALYIQSAGVNGSINLNISKAGVTTQDIATTTTGMTNLLSLLVTMGMAPRRFITGDETTNDAIFSLASAPASTATNLQTIATAVTTASPLSQVVIIGPYNLGTTGTPSVGLGPWRDTWIPAIRQAAITANATFVNMFARFGDVSQVNGDPEGWTVDYLHFGTSLSSHGGVNGQESIAEFFIEKLQYSKDYAISGTLQSGTPADGSVADVIAQGSAGTQIAPGTKWFKTAGDANPVFGAGGILTAFGLPGISAGLGAGSALDTFLVRQATNTWSTGTGGNLAVRGSLYTPGSLLAQVVYTGTQTYSIATATIAAIDTTNLTISFTTGPYTTQVLVVLNAVQVFNSAGTGSQVWCLLTHSTLTQVGYQCDVCQGSSSAIDSSQRPAVASILVTGLSASTAYQLDWGWGATAGTANLDTKSQTSGVATANCGPAVMQVFSA